MKRPVPPSNFRSSGDTAEDLRRVRQHQQEILDWIDAQIADVASNTIVDSTPTTLTSGVIPDLTLFARDGATFVGKKPSDFAAKTGPTAADKILISDAAASDAIKYTTFGQMPRAGLPYIDLPATPDSWDLEARRMTNPDPQHASNGWTITLLDSPWTAQTRVGNIGSAIGANQYNSQIIAGMLCMQFPGAVNIVMYKAITNADFSYKARFWHTNFPTTNSASHFGIATGPQRLTAGTVTYYTGYESNILYEVKLVAPSTFTIYSNITFTTTTPMWSSPIDSVRYIDFTSGAGGNEQVQHRDARTGNAYLNPGNRLFTITPAYCVLHFYNVQSLLWLDFVRRTPYLSLP